MKNIILKSALVLALGVAPGAGLAQTEMLKKRPAQQTEGQTGTQEQGATTKPPTEGEAGTQMKKSQQTEGQVQAPAGQDMSKSTGQTVEDSTGTKMKKQSEQAQEQAPADQGTEQQGTASKTQEQTGTATTEGTAKTKPAPDDDTAKTSSQPSNETTGSVNVTAEQKTEIKQVITETKAEPVRDVNFEVNVGVAVPRTIELQPLPPRIVKLVPRYEGYRYFLLADGRIVIVDPDSLEIVVIIA
jgi:hypothetical protein